MELEEKLKILADSAKYDASCSSSGSKRANSKNGIGNGDVSGICHSWRSRWQMYFPSKNFNE